MEERNNNTTGVAKEEFERSIPDRFEEHVRKHPDRLAFKTTKDALTWDALNRAANRVARAILGACEGRGKPIALLLDREASTMAATLGVLKAKSFYVPLSPSHPRPRNSYIINQTEPALIVTDSRSFSLATELAPGNCHLLNIDELDSRLSTENLGQPISPDSLAFLTYTSGSTGEPKGVINTHRKALYRITHDKHFGLGPGDRFTQPGSTERRSPFAALLSGAGSFPWYVNEEGLEHLADWLIQEEITVYRSGPRIFRQFVSTLTGKEEFRKLRVIVLADEPVYKTDFELYKKHFSSDCLLVNTYGVHEVGPIRMYVISKETEIAGERVPIGYEIPDREVLLLDDYGQEVGFNQVGEIAVRTRDFSPSFWRRPDLMETKFIPDPNGEDRRIYLTGDLGRMSPDGCLEHLGRKDFQVKIRGLRVEIAEVEGALRSMGAIREAVVIVQEDKLGEKRLVAYIVAAGNTTLSVSEVRRFVEQKLPPLMVPSRFIVLDALPLTPNGKVNRRALPDPGSDRPDLDTPYSPARTPMEKEAARIWAEVLSLDRVGVHDDFFELGGHSLAATRVVSHVINAYQLELPLQSLFQAPTVGEMAAVILQHQTKKLGEQELDRILSGVESLSDEEAERSLPQATSRVK
ncbi:MAG: non-ribosomal peptide synthetase [Deltaproteobacteria bacterium]|nr:non-ribosomal peptide synthetase [Deltaproteobacteria bacterium]MDZ4344503.1 non-ribosomal peptide synthetase [Candidatus Binatia bacterium]